MTSLPNGATAEVTNARKHTIRQTSANFGKLRQSRQMPLLFGKTSKVQQIRLFLVLILILILVLVLVLFLLLVRVLLLTTGLSPPRELSSREHWKTER